MTITPAPLTVLDYFAMGVGYAVMLLAAVLVIAVGLGTVARSGRRRKW